MSHPGSHEGWRASLLKGLSDANARCLLAILQDGPPEGWPTPGQAQRLLELACLHRLDMPLWAAFRAAGARLPSWAGELHEPLGELRDRAQVAWCVRAAAARELAAALAARGREALFLKGYVLASEYYPSPELRPFGDLDVLVRPEGIKEAEEVLHALGYRPSAAPVPFGAIERSYLREAAAGLTLDVDLHWTFIGTESLVREMRVDDEELWSRSVLRLPGLRVPATGDFFVLAVANLVRHGYRPLGLYYDLKQMLSRPVQWEEVLARAQAAGVRAALGAALAVAEVFFRAPVPGAVLERLRPAWWQRPAFRRWLSHRRLLRTERGQDVAERFALKLLSLDTLGAVARTVAYMPVTALQRLWRRDRNP